MSRKRQRGQMEAAQWAVFSGGRAAAPEKGDCLRQAVVNEVLLPGSNPDAGM